MTSRERIRQLYYGDKKPSNKKYIVIGVAMIFIVLILFFTLGGNQGGGGTTTTTTPVEQINLEAEVDAIKVKLERAVSSVDNLEKGQSGVTAPRTGGVTAPRTGSAQSSFGSQIDDMLAKIE